MTPPTPLLLHWLPRSICILAILFVSVFALDAFSPGYTLWQQIIAFLIHLIPSFVLVAMLLIAWKWENVGGALLILLGLALCVGLAVVDYRKAHLTWMTLCVASAIGLPFIASGVLFVLSARLKRHRRAAG